MEGALFNEIRADRPMECKVNDGVRQTIENSVNDPFCNETGTPRILGAQREHTAGNSLTTVIMG